MWTAILSFFGGPVISGLIDAYKAKLAAVNSADEHAIDLAKADLLAQIEARKDAASLAGSKWGGPIQAGFGLVILIYYGKCILWDMVLGLGSTPPIKDANLMTWSQLIISFYFGGTIVSNVVNVVARRFGK